MMTSPYENAVPEFLDTAVAELNHLRQHITPDYFSRVADLINASEAGGGRVHLTGIGKSEYVANYIAALFASTGTPAYFLHGTECVHGSAGQVVRGDVVLVISNSGETMEMKAAVKTLKQNGARIVGVSGQPHSWLARECHEFLHVGVEREGSPFELEPRASVLAQMYVLAALSIELQARKNISEDEFLSWHPAGKIGQRANGHGALAKTQPLR
jgi:arabinose-5-phosphate isomerase